MNSHVGDNPIAVNRKNRKWSTSELVGRVLWASVWPFFRFSPKFVWGWRIFLLRSFGATIGENVHIHPTVRDLIPWNLIIDDWSSIGFDAIVYNLGSVRIGKRSTVSQRTHLCAGTHDFRDLSMPLLKRPITIEDDSWICADAFVGPDVTVGTGAVVGARAVVTRDIDSWSIVAGNPARKIGERKLNKTPDQNTLH